VDTFNRGDVEALAADTTEDVELLPALAGALEGGGFHGRAGVEAYFQIIAEARDCDCDRPAACPLTGGASSARAGAAGSARRHKE
jgi:hypothetical protein